MTFDFCRNAETAAKLQRFFLNHTIKKVYWAVTIAQPSPFEGENLSFSEINPNCLELFWFHALKEIQCTFIVRVDK